MNPYNYRQLTLSRAIFGTSNIEIQALEFIHLVAMLKRQRLLRDTHPYDKFWKGTYWAVIALSVANLDPSASMQFTNGKNLPIFGAIPS